MEFDQTAKTFVLDDDDRAMLAVGWDRVAAADARILLTAHDLMMRNVSNWLEVAQRGNDLAQASAARDFKYCEIYGRQILSLLGEHAGLTD